MLVEIVAGMVDSLSRRLVPDGLWEIVRPLIPAVPPRPQGGGTAVTDDRAVFTAIGPGRGGGTGQKGGSLTGPNPVDRGKTGSKHVLSDANGLPLLVGVSAANTHDSHPLPPMVMGLPAIRSRRGPRRRKPARLRADKAYDSAAHRTWLRERGIIPRNARRGIDTSDRLGRYRWKIERTIAWLTGYRRLTIHYERHAHLFAAFLSLAAAITCYKKLAT